MNLVKRVVEAWLDVGLLPVFVFDGEHFEHYYHTFKLSGLRPHTACEVHYSGFSYESILRTAFITIFSHFI